MEKGERGERAGGGAGWACRLDFCQAASLRTHAWSFAGSASSAVTAQLLSQDLECFWVSVWINFVLRAGEWASCCKHRVSECLSAVSLLLLLLFLHTVLALSAAFSCFSQEFCSSSRCAARWLYSQSKKGKRLFFNVVWNMWIAQLNGYSLIFVCRMSEYIHRWVKTDEILSFWWNVCQILPFR